MKLGGITLTYIGIFSQKYGNGIINVHINGLEPRPLSLVLMWGTVHSGYVYKGQPVIWDR